MSLGRRLTFPPRLAIRPLTLKLTVNGEPREVRDGSTVRSLLEELGVEAERVAVEVNTEIVRRARHAEHRLQPGDQIEIVSFVGGG